MTPTTRPNPRRGIALAIAATLILILAATAPSGEPAADPTASSSDPSTMQRVLVQGRTLADAAAAVLGAGGSITHELGIINAVGASLDGASLQALSQDPHVQIFDDVPVNGTSFFLDRSFACLESDCEQTSGMESFYPFRVSADRLHTRGVTGTGVTVAVVDTGYFAAEGLTRSADGSLRVLASYDAINDVEVAANYDPYGSTSGQFPTDDAFGHGSHVTSVVASSRLDPNGNFNGLAPGADLVPVRALDASGAGTYLDVIRGLDWILTNAAGLGIRVVNLSLSSTPRSVYWEDPLNQAVMQLWRAGIVVVTSAGNSGPDAMTITVPGNVPYVITVGAMSDNYTPEDESDDPLASFSAAGPTAEGFIKPEIVAPGGHLLGLLWPQSALAQSHPLSSAQGDYFFMSGTSQAAAVVSGVVALLLQDDPNLTPDEVKCRLMASAEPAIDAVKNRAYTVFQQGAGLIDAEAARRERERSCANQGLDIEADLAGLTHFVGPARITEDGVFYVEDVDGDGLVWDGTYVEGTGFLWSRNNVDADGFLWSKAEVYDSGFLWSNTVEPSYVWTTGLVEPIAANRWVGHE